MAIISINPATKTINQEFQALTNEQALSQVERAQQALAHWGGLSVTQRAQHLTRLAATIRDLRDELASLITQEMGCPITQAEAEMEKCAQIVEYYAENAESWLSPHIQNQQSPYKAIHFDPLGVMLHVAPWNYPMYLALRAVIPSLIAGNTVVLKHASNVPQCAVALEDLFTRSGFPEGVFQTLLIGASQVESIIRHPAVQLITLIGSEKAGMSVAQIAGSEVKPTIMELGGSDPFIVFSDADIDQAVAGAVQSRLRNCGQSCNAAKRFIVLEEVAQEFTAKLALAFETQTIGDPAERTTTLGPLGTESGLRDIIRQVDESVKLGARVITGGRPVETLSGYFYEPTILTGITKAMPVYTEEVFGPVAPIIVVQSVEEAIQVANDSVYGLGASVWTGDGELARRCVRELETGNVYVNAIVRGDPKMPYGGVKRSGFGREFGQIGLMQMVNVKSVVIN